MKNYLKIFAAVGFFIFTKNPVAAVFPDVSPESSNFIAIETLREKGILSGRGDGSFAPDEKINRAEILKIVFAGAGISPAGVPAENPFADVPKLEWFAPWISSAKTLQIVGGETDGNFYPERNVNFAEVLKMLCRANGIEAAAPQKEIFADVPAKSWFAPFFNFAKKSELLPAPQNGKIFPEKFLTRGEVAQIFYKFEKFKENNPPQIGLASFYADFFEARKTSAGEIFSQNQFTAAHQTFDFGTKILVQNLKTSKTVVVKINDRGPYAEGKIIDLTKSAFETISPLSAGITLVKLREMPRETPAGPPTKETCEFPTNSDAEILTDFWEGFSLAQNFPRNFRRGEIYEVCATTAETEKQFYFFVGEKTFPMKFKNGKICAEINFEKTGKFPVGFSDSNPGEKKAAEISVFAPVCEPYFPEISGSFPRNLRIEISEDSAVKILWDDDWNSLFKIQFLQNEKLVEFFVNGKNYFSPPREFFADFAEGLTEIQIFGAPKNGISSALQSKSFARGETKTIFLSRHFSDFSAPEKVENLLRPNSATVGENFAIAGRAENLSDKFFIVSPAGKIYEKDLPVDENGEFKIQFSPREIGAHLIEINDTDGAAILNFPIFQKGFWPVLPDFFDLKDPDNFESTEKFIAATNEKRRAAGLNNLQSAENLTALAAFRAADLKMRNYFAHVDPDGKSINDFRAHHAVKSTVGENLSAGQTLRGMFESLWRSPSHRKNMLGENWKKTAVAILERENGEKVLVQLFATEEFDSAKTAEISEEIWGELNVARGISLAPSATLTAVAQNWTEKMIREKFFAFDSGESNLSKNLENAGVLQTSAALLFQTTNLTELKKQIVAEEIDGQKNFLLDENWQKVGVGLAADEVGNLFCVVTVAE